MAKQARSRLSLATGIVVATAVLALGGLGVVLLSGTSLADQAGRPLDVPAVVVAPSGTSAPSPTPTHSDDDSLEVVEGPEPVTVDLDGHGNPDDSGN